LRQVIEQFKHGHCGQSWCYYPKFGTKWFVVFKKKQILSYILVTEETVAKIIKEGGTGKLIDILNDKFSTADDKEAMPAVKKRASLALWKLGSIDGMFFASLFFVFFFLHFL